MAMVAFINCKSYMSNSKQKQEELEDMRNELNDVWVGQKLFDNFDQMIDDIVDKPEDPQTYDKKKQNNKTKISRKKLMAKLNEASSSEYEKLAAMFGLE